MCAYVSVAFGSKGVGVHHDGRAVLLCSLAEPLCPLESGRLLPGQEIRHEGDEEVIRIFVTGLG